MCNPGANERDDKRFKGAWDGHMSMFRAYRARGAPIGFAPDPRTKHECGDSRYLAIPFFDACLSARLPDAGDGSTRLKPLNPSRAWLAPVLGRETVPASAFQGKASEAVWLPDEHVAKAWMEYVETGAVGDDTPPPSPTDVKATAIPDGGIAVTWNADADFESGLRQFIIHRDGKEIGRARGPGRPVRPAALPDDVVPRHAGVAPAGHAIRRTRRAPRARRRSIG